MQYTPPPLFLENSTSEVIILCLCSVFAFSCATFHVILELSEQGVKRINLNQSYENQTIYIFYML